MDIDVENVTRGYCRDLTVSLAIPVAVLLSQRVGVQGCLWPSSVSIGCIIFASLQLRNRAASSASAADVTTHFKMPQKVKIALFMRMG